MACVALCASASLCAQPDKFGQPLDRRAAGKADQEEGGRILSEFRQAGIAGDYWLSFELRVLPRRGEARVLTGALHGTRGQAGPVSRLTAGAGRWLIESGPQPSAWMLRDGVVEPADPGQPLADSGVTVFDLQMPFLYWTDYTYEGQARMRGRPTYSFILRPPPGQVLPTPEMTGVRVLIDTQFQAMVQAEVLGARNAVLRTIALLDLKRVGDQWLVKSVDIRDHRTRDKTRFTVLAAALDLRWPAEAFTPAGLGSDAPPVPGDRVVRF